MFQSQLILFMLFAALRATSYEQDCLDEKGFRNYHAESIGFPPLKELLASNPSKLGQGMQAEGYKVLFGGEKVVLKVSNLKRKNVSTTLLNNELRIYDLVKDVPGVPKYLGCFHTGHYVVFLLEDGGVQLATPSLYLIKSRIVRIAETLYRISVILRGIHAHGVRHADIKASNALISFEKKRFYLIDFGVSCLEGEEIRTPINRDLSPPEVQRKGTNFCSASTDFWQFSLLGINFFLKQIGVSFENLIPEDCLRKNYTQECYQFFFENVKELLKVPNKELYDLLLQGISYDPLKRPSSFFDVSVKLRKIWTEELANRNALSAKKKQVFSPKSSASSFKQSETPVVTGNLNFL